MSGGILAELANAQTDLGKHDTIMAGALKLAFLPQDLYHHRPLKQPYRTQSQSLPRSIDSEIFAYRSELIFYKAFP